VIPMAGKHMDDIDLAGKLWRKSEEIVAEYLA
jgi:hypothetical protein